MKVLIVAPGLSGIDQTEISEVATGNDVAILHGTVTVSHLETVLRTSQFDAVHCMQHGAVGLLQMSDRAISEERFALALSQQRHMRFVFLNACNSAGIASRIHNVTGSPVIFHEVPIDDKLAVRLASEFYNCLAGGITLQKALDDANATVARDARNSGVSFVEAHLINGQGQQVIADKLDHVFGLMTTQLADIDTRLASVEDQVKRIGHPQYLVWLLCLVGLLVVAQVGTAIVNALIAH